MESIECNVACRGCVNKKCTPKIEKGGHNIEAKAWKN